MNTLAKAEAQRLWADIVIRCLVANRVTDVVVSPGSRSTPLVLAVAENDELRSHVIIDERSAAFFALGMARERGTAVALVCTSGTAGAHYFPAIVEASESEIPLVAITADRPSELLHCAAPQTTTQKDYFGVHARVSLSVEVPAAELQSLNDAAAGLTAAIGLCHGPRPGPVHLNLHFAKPLEAGPRTQDEVALAAALSVQAGPASGSLGTDREGVDKVVAALQAAERGLIVCGPGVRDRELRSAVAALAKETGFPVLAETCSDFRFSHAPVAVPSFDAILSNPRFRRSSSPQVCIEIGRPPVSKSYASYLAEHPEVARFVFSPTRDADPQRNAAHVFRGSWSSELQRIAEQIQEVNVSPEWQESWRAAQREIGRRAAAEADTAGHEGGAIAAVARECTQETLLLLGNSLPVRQVDTYWPDDAGGCDVATQRGVAGIDGLIAGAAGAAHTRSGSVLVLIGDVSFSHDVGSLALLAEQRVAVGVLVLNNDGGRIFDQLPIASHSSDAIMDKFFRTRPSVRLRELCAAYGLSYRHAKTPAEIEAGLREGIRSKDPFVLEMQVKPGSALASAERYATWDQP